MFSLDPDTTSLPSGEKATDLTPSEWPSSVCSAAPVSVSQSCTVFKHTQPDGSQFSVQAFNIVVSTYAALLIAGGPLFKCPRPRQTLVWPPGYLFLASEESMHFPFQLGVCLATLPTRNRGEVASALKLRKIPTAARGKEEVFDFRDDSVVGVRIIVEQRGI